MSAATGRSSTAACGTSAAKQLRERLGTLQEHLGDDFQRELKNLLDRDKYKDTTLERSRHKLAKYKLDMKDLNQEGREVLLKVGSSGSTCWAGVLLPICEA